MCHLYEARKVEMPTELNDFVETVKDIDPDLGLLQTCELNTGNGTDNHVDTRFGKSPAGAYRPPYPSLPLDDVNDDFLLHVPEDLDTLQNRLLNDLKVTMLDANKIEENTKAQHTCSAWTEERKFRFTASNFGRVSRRKRNHKKFCNDLLDAKPFRSASTDHGIKYEPVALREYEKYMHKIGRPIKVEKSGFFVSPNLFYLGCSPDGKVIDISSIDQFGLVEIKCPSSKFSVTPTEACSDPHVFLEVVDGKPKLKKNMFLTMIKSRAKWPSLELNGVIL